MAHELRIGLVGLDTSHVVAFTKLLNVVGEKDHVPGARVIAGYPGGSDDIDLSRNRVEGFTRDLREKYGVEIMDSPEAVAKACDLVFITAVDGRVHRSLFERIVPFKRPTFVDKPFTTSLDDAKEIFRLAGQHDVPVMSCSSLRYADGLTDMLAQGSPVIGCDAFGPMDLIPQMPGFFWYGVHVVEIIQRVMGSGCRSVTVTRTDNFDLLTGRWSDNRVATMRGVRNAHHKYGVTLHRKDDFDFVNLQQHKRAAYANMLDAILKTLPQGKSDVAKEDTLEVIKIIEAANQSRESGKTVTL
ncbi:MAG TPA: Gfo/Idh/MocA family oxidoreductase [Tepidisphaeraceae bacterium]|nr:Gfo/Idh/MocA family oxidoreductase [Tepidisphaeraceae bacterium]